MIVRLAPKRPPLKADFCLILPVLLATDMRGFKQFGPLPKLVILSVLERAALSETVAAASAKSRQAASTIEFVSSSLDLILRAQVTYISKALNDILDVCLLGSKSLRAQFLSFV